MERTNSKDKEGMEKCTGEVEGMINNKTTFLSNLFTFSMLFNRPPGSFLNFSKDRESFHRFSFQKNLVLCEFSLKMLIYCISVYLTFKSRSRRMIFACRIAKSIWINKVPPC